VTLADTLQNGVPMDRDSSTGLSPRTALLLAYSGWWVTGGLFWLVERRDRMVRYHAAQAVVVFGLAALLTVVFGGLALVSLSFFPGMFTLFATIAGVSWAAGMVLWIVAMAMALRGKHWRVPFAEAWASRLAARSHAGE
jgi:uncharacterized membrane protein